MESLLLSLMAFYFFYLTVLGLLMFRARLLAVKNGEIKASYFKSYQSAVPARLKVWENHFVNQFQCPMIFMILGALALSLHLATPIFVGLAVTFVASRLLHSWIHLTSNKVLRRAGAFFFGVIILNLMWLCLLIEFRT